MEGWKFNGEGGRIMSFEEALENYFYIHFLIPFFDAPVLQKGLRLKNPV